MRYIGVTVAAVGSLLGAARSHAAGYVHSDYTWYEYNGHEYAITFERNNWADAEAEAEAVGGTLANVNDAAENAWLSWRFQGYYDADPTNPWASLVWIGAQDVKTNMSWVCGDPVTYTAPIWWGDWCRTEGGADYGYLHTDTHPSPGTWNNAVSRDTIPAHYPHGVIERIPLCSRFTTSDFLPPMGRGEKFTDKVDVKFGLFYEDQSVRSQAQLDEILAANGCDSARPTIVVWDVTDPENPADISDLVPPNDGEGEQLGHSFRFSNDDGKCIYNLYLERPPFSAGGTYKVEVKIGENCTLKPGNDRFEVK